MSIKKLAELQRSLNIAEMLDDAECHKIASKVIDEFELDDRSRSEWKMKMDASLKIAKQVMETKTFPWPNASNVKFPLIAGAAIQYAARTYPEIIKNDRVVHAKVKEGDITQQNRELLEIQAEAIAKHMSYQLLVDSDNWEDSFDRMLHMYAILGTVFKKVYYDPICQKNCVEVCSPEHVVLNHNITSLDQSRRISHRIFLHKNELVSGVNAGVYCDLDFDCLDEDVSGPTQSSDNTLSRNHTNPSASQDPDLLHEFIEQHRFLDLDDDGYQEPYIVTVHKKSKKVLRIVSRWDLGTERIENDKVIHIPAIDYFIDFHFLPSPDGKFYSLGFGSLLGSLNESINSVLNQLIDSGTLNNQQSGIIAKGVRIKGGSLSAQMGEFITVDTVGGASLRDNIFPFPFHEPSQVLFQLLGLLIQSGKELSSVTDIMTGNAEAQNVPATTQMSLNKNGLVVFTAIQKRLHRALKKEFEALYRLNSIYLDEVDPIKKMYQDDRISVHPVSDPNLSSDVLRLARVQAILQAVTTIPAASGGINEALLLFYKELQVPDEVIAKLLVPPPPNPAAIKANVEAQRDHVKMQLDQGTLQINQQQAQLAARKQTTEEQLAKANIEKLRADSILHLAQAKQQDTEFRVKSYIDALSKIDPNNTGVKHEHVKPLLDALMQNQGVQTPNIPTPPPPPEEEGDSNGQ